MAESVLSKLVGTDKDTKEELSSLRVAVNKIAKTQEKILSMQEKNAKRDAQDKKRDKADSPLLGMFKKQEKNEKKKEGWFNKILKILGTLGSALGGLGGGLLKVLGLGGLAATIKEVFTKKFWGDLFLKAFGKGGWMQSAWKGAFGKGGWAQSAWTKAFGKDGWAQSVWTKAFGKGGWASKAFKVASNTGIGQSVIKALTPITTFFAGLGKDGLGKGIKGALGGLGKKFGNKVVPGLGALIEGVTTFQETKDVGQAGAAGGGALAGGLGGAKLGAMIGTAIAPGIGTAIGGFLGGVGGTIIGSELGQGLYKMIAENPAVMAITDFFNGYLKGVFETFKETWSSFTTMIDTIGKSLRRFNDEVIGPFFTSIGDFFKNTWENYVNTVKNFTTAISDFVTGVWDKFTSAISNVTDFLGKTFSPVIEGISNFLDKTLRPVLDKIGEFLKPIIDPLKQLATTVLSPLVKGFEMLKSVIDKFAGLLGFGEDGFELPTGEEVGKAVSGFFLNPFKNAFDNVNNSLKGYAEGGDKPETEAPKVEAPKAEKPEVLPPQDQQTVITPKKETTTGQLPQLTLPEMPNMGDLKATFSSIESRLPKFPVVGGLPQIGFPGSKEIVAEVVKISKGIQIMLKMEASRNPEDFKKSSLGLQTGGIVPGSGTGDVYGPVGLPTGSLVLNRNATAMMGLQTGGVVPTMLEPGEAVFGPGSWTPMMAAMNSTIPRFQTGGVVSSDGDKDTGPGYQPGEMMDSFGRPVIFSKGGADSWLKMSQLSGGKVKGTDINSAQRSQSKNRAVGGVDGSNHLYGNGVDVQTGSSSWKWMRANDDKYGWKWNDYMGPDGWHFDYTGSNSNQPPATEAPKDGKEKGASEAGPMSTLMGSLSGLGAAGEAAKGVFDIFKEVMGEDSGALMQALGLNNTKALEQIVANDKATGGGYTGKEGASVSDPNAKALLNAIADAEGTSKYQNNGYNTMFTGKQFNDLSDHPRKVQNSSGYSSDAAGRYQFLSTTWDEMGMSDMSAKSQDKAALKLLSQSGVNITDGLNTNEVYKVGQKWASVEGGPQAKAGGSYGSQAKYNAAEFMSMYEKYGGKIEGKQKGGVTNMKPISSDKFIKANEAFADQMSKGQQPIVIPMPVPSGGGAQPTINNPGTQTAPPNLPDGPSSIQSAEYFYRLNMGSVF
jgi:muramidase (phage lysozyme)